MEIVHSWKKSISVMALATIALTGTTSFAVAQSAMEQVQVAQATPGSLVGQCRAAKKPTPVYDKNTPGAKVIRTLNTDERVTLADNGSNGFIGISAPVNGFVSTVDLKTCGGTTQPPGNTCRRVIQPQGLVIRRDANPNSASLGGVAYLDRVYLTTTPATTKVGPDGRNWVQVARPLAGWVSNGFPGNVSNLGLCP